MQVFVTPQRTVKALDFQWIIRRQAKLKNQQRSLEDIDIEDNNGSWQDFSLNGKEGQPFGCPSV